MQSHHIPNNYFGSPLGLLHFQQQLQQQAINSSLFQRPGVPLSYHNALQHGSLLGGSTGIPASSMTGAWSPYFLFARGPQPNNSTIGPPADTSPGNMSHIQNRAISSMPPASGHNNPGPPNVNPNKELMLNSSIESLRMRARQHSASLGLYD